MPMLQVQADDGTVIWRERVTAPDFETEHFRRCLAEGTAPEPSLDDALGDARWIEAIARAYGRGGRA